MLPPLDVIIIGPCPECEGLVAIFCGSVLPLNAEIMRDGSAEEKIDHLMDVLGGFLKARVTEMVRELSSPHEDSLDSNMMELPQAELDNEEFLEEIPELAMRPISQEEVDRFSDLELDLLDNSDYFHAVFT